MKNLLFSHIGIAKANLYQEDSNRLSSWVDNGYHAQMEWMKARLLERANIFEYYPEAKSIIIITQNYYTGQSNFNNDIKISNYAWGDDYHLVMKKKLYQLLDSIKQYDSDLDGIVCVDTSPVMEKPWAQRAGIGWIGKHTNLITKDIHDYLLVQ